MKTLQVSDDIYVLLQGYAEARNIECSKVLEMAIEEFLDPGISLREIVEKLVEHDGRLALIEGDRPVLSLDSDKEFN